MRYYFHFQGKGDPIIDGEGSELNDLDAAREEARISAREVLGLDNGGRSARYLGGRFEITDGHGTVLTIVEFKESKLG